MKGFVLGVESGEHGVTVIGIKVDKLYKRNVAAHKLLLGRTQHRCHVSVKGGRRLTELSKILANNVKVGLALLLNGETLSVSGNSSLFYSSLGTADIAPVMVP